MRLCLHLRTEGQTKEKTKKKKKEVEKKLPDSKKLTTEQI